MGPSSISVVILGQTPKCSPPLSLSFMPDDTQELSVVRGTQFDLLPVSHFISQSV